MYVLAVHVSRSEAIYITVRNVQYYEIKQQKETLMSHEITERLWDKIGADSNDN